MGTYKVYGVGVRCGCTTNTIAGATLRRVELLRIDSMRYY